MQNHKLLPPFSPKPCKFEYFYPLQNHAFPRSGGLFTDDEILPNGNMRAALFVLKTIAELDALDRLVLGTDSPAGSGVQPLGMMRLVTMPVSLGGIAPEVAICLATGNVARMRRLTDRGVIEVGRAADLVLIDQAMGGAGRGLADSMILGNMPGIGMILVDGVPRIARSRNTPPSILVPEHLAN